MALSKVARKNTTIHTESIVAAQSEDVVMDIDASALAFIIDRLTDLYPNPIEATVREVVSNAIDATVLVDGAQPVEVFSPSAFNPVFVVVDHGIGMSVDDVRTVYSKYGASTKANAFNQIGAYGLGAKAPLSYCTEFFVETTKDGVTTNVVVSRKSEGNVLSIVSSTHTGKASGTKVSIPVKQNDVRRFDDALSHYRTFSIPVVIDGMSESAEDTYSLLVDDFVLDEDSHTTGRIWIKNIHAGVYFRDLFFGKSPWYESFSFMLSGWVYRNPGYGNGGYSNFLVELKPGVVDFSSSRDEITNNERFTLLYDRLRTVLFDFTDTTMLSRALAAAKNDDKNFEESYSAIAVSLVWRGIAVDNAGNVRAIQSGNGFPISDFENKDGVNPIEIMTSRHDSTMFWDKNVGEPNNYSVACFGKDEISDNFFKIKFANVDTDSRGNPLKHPDDIVADGDEIDLVQHFLILEDGAVSENDNVVIVYGIDERSSKSLIRARKSIESLGYTRCVATGMKPNQEDMATIRAFFSGDVSVVSFDEMWERVKADRKSRRAEKQQQSSSNVLHDMFDVATYTVDSVDNIRNVGLVGNVGTTLDSIISENALVAFVSTVSSTKVRNVLMTMRNMGVDLVGRKVYFFTNRNPIRAAHFNALVDYRANIYVFWGYDYNSKGFDIIADDKGGHLHEDTFLNEDLDKFSRDAVIAHSFFPKFSRYNLQKVAKIISNYVEDDFTKEVFHAVANCREDDELFEKKLNMNALVSKVFTDDETATLTFIVDTMWRLVNYSYRYNDAFVRGIISAAMMSHNDFNDTDDEILNLALKKFANDEFNH